MALLDLTVSVEMAAKANAPRWFGWVCIDNLVRMALNWIGTGIELELERKG